MPVDEQTTHIPAVEGGSVEPVPVAAIPDVGLVDAVEDPPETPETSLTPLSPLGLKDVLRIVVFGGFGRLGGPIAFPTAFTVKPAGVVSNPDSHFEAGICAASADILVFDMTKIEFGAMLELLSVIGEYVPRAVVVALLEPGSTPNTIPQCGIHLVIPEPFTAESVAKGIERLIFGTEI